MVFLGSRGWDPSITKSLSFRFQGRIWTYQTKKRQTGFSNRIKKEKAASEVITASFTEFITALQEMCVCECVCSHWPACLWWWGWTHKGTACRPLRCRHRSKPAPSSHPGTAGRRSLHKLEYNYSCCWGCTVLTVTFSTFDCRSDKDVLQPQMEPKSLYKQSNISVAWYKILCAQTQWWNITDNMSAFLSCGQCADWNLFFFCINNLDIKHLGHNADWRLLHKPLGGK